MDIRKRLRNEVTVISFATMFLSVIYNILAMFGVTVSVSESEVLQTITIFINMLALLGILVDPTTKGITDIKKDTSL